MSFLNIPDELKSLNQWIVWRLEDREGTKPTKTPYCAKTGAFASVSDSRTWCNFETALLAANSGFYSGLGFVLTPADPYTFIDFDDPWELDAQGKHRYQNPQELQDRQTNILKDFKTYAEKSQSGKGLHLICKATVPSGKRHGAIEIYSSHRYMVMTGDVFQDCPISDCQELANDLWALLAKDNHPILPFEDCPQELEDEEIVSRATGAQNGEKVSDLISGNWEKYYSSQSEADLALVNILAFYSYNREQIARIFRSTELGRRPKAQRVDYLNYMLNKAFDRQMPKLNFELLFKQVKEELQFYPNPIATPEHKPGFVKENPFEFPQGLVGEIAKWVLEKSPRPTEQAAVAAALSVMAGVCGRSWNVEGTGLNLMTILVASTGTGKEGMAMGIDGLFAAIQSTVPSALDFLGPSEVSSPQALGRHLATVSPCYLSVVGEFGIKLRQLSDSKLSNMEGLRRMMLALYSASGKDRVLRGQIYASKEKNCPDITSPAFSLLGEGNPLQFYGSLTQEMIQEGLIPRLTIIEYNGLRPPLNKTAKSAKPKDWLVQQFATLCSQSLSLKSNNKVQDVAFEPDAEAIADSFNTECDKFINEDTSEVTKQLWNRAHLKVLKIAALIAIGRNMFEPKINKSDVLWAKDLIVSQTLSFAKSMLQNGGSMSTPESQQMEAIMWVIKSWITKSGPNFKMREHWQGFRDHNLIPYSYIMQRTSNNPKFIADKRGLSVALNSTLKSLEGLGLIQECNTNQILTKFGTKQRCFWMPEPQVILEWELSENLQEFGNF